MAGGDRKALDGKLQFRVDGEAEEWFNEAAREAGMSKGELFERMRMAFVSTSLLGAYPSFAEQTRQFDALQAQLSNVFSGVIATVASAMEVQTMRAQEQRDEVASELAVAEAVRDELAARVRELEDSERAIAEATSEAARREREAEEARAEARAARLEAEGLAEELAREREAAASLRRELEAERSARAAERMARESDAASADAKGKLEAATALAEAQERAASAVSGLQASLADAKAEAAAAGAARDLLKEQLADASARVSELADGYRELLGRISAPSAPREGASGGA